jgi:acyl carrier protein
VVLIRPTTLPRTTSGKIRRTLSAELYANQKLKVMAQWSKGDVAPAAGDLPLPRRRATADSPKVNRLAEQIELKILEWLRDRVGVPTTDLDRDRPFGEYGVDSMAAVELSGELEDWLSINLSPMTAWQYPTPAAIARHLAVESLSSAEDDQPEPEAEEPPDDPGLEQILQSLDSLSESEAAELLNEGNTAL